MGNDTSGEYWQRRRADAAEEAKRRMQEEKQALQEQFQIVENERNIQRMREEEKKRICKENRFKEEEERKRIHIEKQNAQKENKTVN